MDNHEDEEDENSGHKIHQHLQHQDYNIQRFQSFIFVLVARLSCDVHNGTFEINLYLIFIMETVIVMKESNIEKNLPFVASCSMLKSSQRISGRL